MKRKSVWWMLGLVVLTGCVPSLHAIYTEQDLVFNPDVLGVWTQEKSPETWEFQRRDDQSYRLIYTDRQGHTGSFIAHLADIGGTQFLDLFPEHIEDATPGFYQFHQVPIHSIYLVKQVDAKVVLAAIDYTWLENYVKDQPTEVPSATFGSRRMLTASTEQLQTFLVANKQRFIHDFELVRTPTVASELEETNR